MYQRYINGIKGAYYMIISFFCYRDTKVILSKKLNLFYNIDTFFLDIIRYIFNNFNNIYID